MKKLNNYKLASNLLIGAVSLVGINSLIVNSKKSSAEIIVSLIVFLILLILSIMVRKGAAWLRYLFLFLIIFSLISLIISISTQIVKPLWGLINVIINILQIWALVLLFKGDKKQEVIS